MELFALLKALKYNGNIKETEDSNSIDDYLKYCKYILSKGVKNITLTLGSKGALVVMNNNKYEYVKVEAIPPSQIKNTNGDINSLYFLYVIFICNDCIYDKISNIILNQLF